MKTKIANIPTYILIDYIEYERSKEEKNEVSKISLAFGALFNTDIKNLTEDVKVNGFKNHFILSILNDKALLTDGNHRIVSAVDLLIENVDTKLEYVDELEDLTYKAYVLEKMHKAVNIKNDLKNYLF